MNLLEKFELIKNSIEKSSYAPGSVEKIFEYNEKCKRNEAGELPEIIKLEPEEKKKKRSIN